jgi:hypothetical protein
MAYTVTQEHNMATLHKDSVNARICQLINRRKIMYVSDYARKVSKFTGSKVSKAKIMRKLVQLRDLGHVAFIIEGGKVYGIRK